MFIKMEGVLPKLEAIAQRKDINAYELLLFMFYVIAMAEDIETTAKNTQRIISLYSHVLALESDKAKPLLLSHLLSAVLEMHEDQNQKLNIFRAVHVYTSKVYDKDSLILTKMKTQETQILLKAEFPEIDLELIQHCNSLVVDLNRVV